MHVVVNPPYGSIEMVLFRKGKLERVPDLIPLHLFL